MVGQIKFCGERGRSRGEVETIGGLSVLTCGLYDRGKGTERRLRRLEQLFRRAEVTRVILPDGFPHRDRLELMRPVDPMPLYRGAADLLVLKVLERKGVPPQTALAALSAPSLSPELCAAARNLCRSVRRLRIDVPGEEGEAFSYRLHREFGIPILPSTAPVDASAAFGDTGATSDLRLYGQSGIRLRAEGLDLPEEIEQPVLQLLWERGIIKREQLQVINLP